MGVSTGHRQREDCGRSWSSMQQSSPDMLHLGLGSFTTLRHFKLYGAVFFHATP
jgi:hypothetical protein